MSFPKKKNFLEVLRETDRKGKSTFATWYDKHGKPQNKYTFSELWNEAGYITNANHHLTKGDRVILCYSFGLQFFAAFLGCLRAGVVDVLIYPPSPSNMAKSLEKMNKVVDDSKPKLILIDSTINLLRMNPLSKTRHLWPKNVGWKVHPKTPKKIKKSRTGMIDVTLKCTSNWNGVSIVPEDIVFLQYTSGSTGDPKGVMVSFHSLEANVEFIHNGIQNQMKKKGIKPDDIVGFSWLPQYHDMRTPCRFRSSDFGPFIYQRNREPRHILSLYKHTGPEADPWRAYIGAQAPRAMETTRSNEKYQMKDIFSDDGIIEKMPSNIDDENNQAEQKAYDIENPTFNDGGSDDAFEVNPFSDDGTI